MTRSLCDLVVKTAGVISNPEVKTIPLCAHHRMLVLASDGVRHGVVWCTLVLVFVPVCSSHHKVTVRPLLLLLPAGVGRVEQQKGGAHGTSCIIPAAWVGGRARQWQWAQRQLSARQLEPYWLHRLTTGQHVGGATGRLRGLHLCTSHERDRAGCCQQSHAHLRRVVEGSPGQV